MSDQDGRTELRLDKPFFAAWSRNRRVTLPYPIDLSSVGGAAVDLPSEDPPGLRVLRRVLGDKRLAVFTLRADPEQITECAVAVAPEHDDQDAALIRVDRDGVGVRRVGGAELISALGAQLPDLAALRITPTELDESRWNGLLAQLKAMAEGRPNAEALDGLGLPDPLVRAMRESTDRPVPVGTMGVLVWRGTHESLGPTVVTWHEYSAGAVLTHVLAPRRAGGPLRVRIGSYDRADAMRTLGEAVSTALYRTRE